MNDRLRIGETINEVKRLREDFNTFTETFTRYQDTMELRVRTLEDWKLKFVAKFSVYSSIALLIGSFLAQLSASYLTHFVK